MPRTKRNDESVDSSCLRGHTDGRLCRLGLARLAFSENVIGLGGPDKGFGLTIMFFDIREGSILGELPFREIDRKSTRLNSSHMSISYAVFCLKKKKKN